MKKARKPSPDQAAKETRASLHAAADAKRAASYQRYFKEPVVILGVENKTTIAIRSDLLARVGETWTVDDAVRFCDAMVRDPSLEARGTGFQVVAHFVPEAPPTLLADIHRWLAGACGNWGLVDNLAQSVLSPLLERHPPLVAEMTAWTKAESPWVRRGAVVGLVPLASAGRKGHLTAAYRIAERLLDNGEREDLLHKAVGWLLREAGKANMARLEKFVLRHGPRMPRTMVRYAIERFPADERARLLAATRAPAAPTGSRRRKA